MLMVSPKSENIIAPDERDILDNLAGDLFKNENDDKSMATDMSEVTELEVTEHRKELPWYTFYHDSRPRMSWDLLIILLALWNCIYIPIDVSFRPEKSAGITISDAVIDILFAVDIVINFMTTYVNEKTGITVSNPTRIVKNYLFKGRFFVDLLASIPFDKVLPTSDNPEDTQTATVLGLLKMVRLLRLGRIITFMKFKQGVKIGFRIFQLLFLLLLLVHWIGCIWFLIINTEEQDWIPPKDLDSQTTTFFTIEKNE
jgi:hypothetical protein